MTQSNTQALIKAAREVLAERDRMVESGDYNALAGVSHNLRIALAAMQLPGEWMAMANAPKDKPILLDAGYPWPVVGIWNDANQKWAYANLQCGMVDGEWSDTYWESDQEPEFDSKGNRNIDGWQPLPPTSKNKKVSDE